MKPLRRSGDTAAIGYRLEVQDLLDIHDYSQARNMPSEAKKRLFGRQFEWMECLVHEPAAVTTAQHQAADTGGSSTRPLSIMQMRSTRSLLRIASESEMKTLS